MKAFHCQKCGERLFFDNSFCISCKSSLGFLPDVEEISVINPAGQDKWSAMLPDGGQRNYRKCQNYTVEKACTWMIPAEDSNAFCISCRLNRTIPDLSTGDHYSLWRKMEYAKRRLVYTLLRLRLPVFPKSPDALCGLSFDILADDPSGYASGYKILTGHMDGVITMNLAEADDAEREKIRQSMGEMYRTLLGHFRHESGHYYWDLLLRDHARIQEFRNVFGDERVDYTLAIQNHYARGGAPVGWESSFVTPYAASHPWEDWAETWAHYLHITDTLETAAAGGVEIHSPHGLPSDHRVLANPHCRNFNDIKDDWHALRFVINSLNRSMGMPDPYPFVLSDKITEKLEFIHRWIKESQTKEKIPAVGTSVAIS